MPRFADPTLTADDLPTLRRLVTHYDTRAAHRGLAGAVACRTLARICGRLVDVIERHGAMHPEIDYHARNKSD